jgi:hypothetical protein
MDKPIAPMRKSKFLVITPKKISLIIFIAFLILVFGYFWHEINFLISAPKLEVSQPSMDVTATDPNFEILGRTEATALLTINGKEVYIDNNGNFKADFNLSEGLNTIKIEVKNRFNKVNSIIRRIFYAPK